VRHYGKQEHNQLLPTIFNEEKAMKNIRSISICMLGILAAGAIWLGLAGTVAQATNKTDTSAAAAFNKLKTLAGTWQSTSKNGKVTTSYEVISNGTALVEHLNTPGEGNMLTVFHLDGDRLVLTHYCTAGNQPHMQAETYDPASSKIVFNFDGGGSLSDASVGHMHNVAFKFTSADAFSADWTFQENGKPKFTENIAYHRVK
jgi:outer membrane lipoprotein-sorting protein